MFDPSKVLCELRTKYAVSMKWMAPKLYKGNLTRETARKAESGLLTPGKMTHDPKVYKMLKQMGQNEDEALKTMTTAQKIKHKNQALKDFKAIAKPSEKPARFNKAPYRVLDN